MNAVKYLKSNMEIRHVLILVLFLISYVSVIKLILKKIKDKFPIFSWEGDQRIPDNYDDIFNFALGSLALVIIIFYILLLIDFKEKYTSIPLDQKYKVKNIQFLYSNIGSYVSSLTILIILFSLLIYFDSITDFVMGDPEMLRKYIYEKGYRI